MKEVKITLVKSVIGQTQRQRATIKTLGLGKISSTVVQKMTPDIEGKIKKVAHLVKTEEI